MKSRTQLLFIWVFVITSTLSFSPAVFAQYNIASQEYAQLSEQYLQHIAHMEWKDSYKMLATDVVFKLPNGDAETRTTYTGIKAIKAFWDTYVEQSGNDRTTFTDFVHVPMMVNTKVDHIDGTGIFNLCYFSAQLNYGVEVANVRMHWAIHFNASKKIDGIYTYYDRTPIIAAAKKNFLNQDTQEEESGVVVQSIKIKSSLSEDQLIEIAQDRAHQFRKVPGLIQKYYVRHSEPGYYGGIYLWDSKASLQAFMKTELAATMSKAYKIVDAPRVEISGTLFKLRE